MLNDNVIATSINYSDVATLIPEVMNALYNEDALASTNLEEIRDAFRVKQLQGKTWLLDKVKEHTNPSDRILIIGSWIGFTSFCLHKFGYYNITEVDPDARLEPLARWLNRFNKSFTHITDDINNVDVSQYDVVINTSCEHILNNEWFDNIPAGVKLFLHSIDYPSWDHTNLCKDVNEMVEKYPMSLTYAGTLNLGQYNRFMLVGQK